MNWVKEEYDLDIKVSQGITYVQQDEATKNKLREIVDSMSDIELSGNSVFFLYVSVDIIFYFENTRLTFLATFGKKKIAFERATLTAKSFLIGLAVVKRHLSVEKAWTAASLEVLDQIDRWGEVEDSHDVDREFVKSQLASARLANISTY